MKHIYMIGGTMGIGKTTTCHVLKEKLNNSVFLDGDWCWDMDPFQMTEETMQMVEDNICFLLNNFIHCSAYENIIFCWVLHKQSLIDAILARLDTENCNVKLISLVCHEEALLARLNKDIRSGIRKEAIISRSIGRLPLYESLNTTKIDVSNMTVQQVADLIETC